MLEFHIYQRLGRVEAMLGLVLVHERKIMTALTDLQAAVAAEDTELGAVVAYLNGLPALIAAAVAAASAGDTATVAAITADVTSQTAALAAALTAAPQATPPAS